MFNRRLNAIWVLLSLAVPTPSQARQAPIPDAPILKAAGAFFALSVPDLGASARWYSEKLGLKIVMEVPRSDKTAVKVLEGGGLIVELIQNADAGVKGNGLVHGFFKAGIIIEDFDKTLAVLKSRGVEFAYGPYPAQNNQRANVIIRDNAGNLIQLFGR